MGYVDGFLSSTVEFFSDRARSGERPSRRPLRERPPRPERPARPARPPGPLSTSSSALRPTGDFRRDLGRGIEQAKAFASEQIDPAYWPRVMVALSQSNTVDIVLRNMQDWPSAPSNAVRALRRLQSVEIPIPPSLEFAQWLASLGSVESVFASETPVSLVAPRRESSNISQASISTSSASKPYILNNKEHVTRVCIIDTGIDMSHPDFPVILSDNIRDCTEEGNALDGSGHGTHVTGIIAGQGRASNGRFRGVAQGVEILVAKALESDGKGSIDYIMDALEWAAEQDVDVINISLGMDISPDNPGPGLITSTCQKIAEQGTIVCAAMGNDGPADGTIKSPGDAPGVISVGAIDSNGRLADFSSRGFIGAPLEASKPDCVALGVDVVAPKAALFQPYNDSHYISMDGTSMACPFVSGAAAILVSMLKARGNDHARQIAKKAIIDGLVPYTGGANRYKTHEVGGGRVDIERSIQLISI